ncbi:hypothetical protein CRG98_023056 [Punica granatum]|uniref:Retrotransposon Copia-like N-terminal domain-containing protein n=1 Tax=Punica granatum TaxID=22663 RepID=A0A2I0JKR5_PUNGR|nr:hypothetical protein CRG98_023056 [Punica granatum]
MEADLLSIFTVNPSDYTGVSLINCKLNGSNYLTWSRAMLTALTAKNKVGMIDGSVPRPPEGDPNRAKWDMCNALVISWIFNTLNSELQSSVACATVAQTLWEDLHESRVLKSRIPLTPTLTDMPLSVSKETKLTCIFLAHFIHL